MFPKSIFISFLIFLNIFHIIISFNLSPQPNIVIGKPNFATWRPQHRSSYFGFSLVLREKSILIGAPRAQSTLLTQVDVDEIGAIYKCSLDLAKVTCKPFVFNTTENRKETEIRGYENHNYQWLGATMDGGSKDDEPLIACAPRFFIQNSELGVLCGICYQTKNTLNEEPIKNGEIRIRNPLISKNYPARNNYPFLSEMGLSAHVTADNKEFLIGAPSHNFWSGALINYKIDNNAFNIKDHFKDYDYNGYAVGSGYVRTGNRSELFYLSTAPRADGRYGKAYIFSNIEYFINTAILRGTQLGEYYGYAALVSDINGDKLDDVIITAPLHRIEDAIDIGAIYVYINEKVANNDQFKLTQNIIRAPFQTNARFGTTITSLGDINHDGYNDIAVGAPLFNDTGAVVIYHGSSQGLRPQPSQILQLPKHFRSSHSLFGHGLSKGVDIDGNGYVDLAVAAPNIETVFIYRSYPVVSTSITFNTSAMIIPLEATNLTYLVCYSLSTGDEATLKLQLVADQRLQRVKFESEGNESFQIEVEVLATPFEQCRTFNAILQPKPEHMLETLNATLSIHLSYDGSAHTQQDFCANCVIMHPKTQTDFSNIVKYVTDCKNDICDVNLALKLQPMPYKLMIGFKTTLKIGLKITNFAEKAYNTKILITNSLNLYLAYENSACEQFDDMKIICDVAGTRYFFEGEEYLELIFDVEDIIDDSELWIFANATCMGHELEPSNNQVMVNVQFKRPDTSKILPLQHNSITNNLLTFGSVYSQYLWSFILGFVIGIWTLSVITICLLKLGFFKRVEKEKLLNELAKIRNMLHAEQMLHGNMSPYQNASAPEIEV